MIINGENLILGRLANHAAKAALLGEEVKIVNCEKVVITGNKANIIEDYKHRIERGHNIAGPFYSRQPDKLVRRAIRGMLPYKYTRGREAYAKIKCYNQIPDALKNADLETVERVHINRNKAGKFVNLRTICKEIGDYGR